MSSHISHTPKFKPLPFHEITGWLDSLDEFILLETGLPGPENRYSYIFHKPVDTIELQHGSPSDVRDAIYRLDEVVHSHFVAGYIAYETGYLLHQKLYPHSENRPPVFRFGVYNDPVCFDHRSGCFNRKLPVQNEEKSGTFSVEDIHPVIQREEYTANVDRIRKYIEEGYTYQVNYTTKLNFSFSGSPVALYAILRKAQPTAYSALIRRGNRWILSFSPELFFKIENGIITSRPMKGTISRGRTNAEDEMHAERLRNDEKNRAENLMIVDLLRNDIGTMAETGSVKVPSLFDVEKYRTVMQMTSTVTGKLKNQLSWYDIFSNMFPCGSVTGAPKLRTMEIISELEPHTRGIYTGAIGMIKPGGDAVFNVPIRTIEIKDDRGSMGIGSGIVWDSDPGAEYEECLLKAHFLTQPYKPVELIESMRYENGYYRLEMHLARMMDSANYFDIPVDRESIQQALTGYEKNLTTNCVYKIRLTLQEDGFIAIEHAAIPASIEQPVRLKICTTPTDSTDRFLYHKTNRRELYRSEFKKAHEEGYFDVLFRNERGEVTEGAITNIYIKQNGILYTPPLESGLLNGVYRRMMLEEGRVREKAFTLEDLMNAEEIYISNSVRGILRGYIGERI